MNLDLCIIEIATMDEFKYELKIPKERVAVLIGQKGQTKRLIEKETSTKLDIDSDEGDVTVSGEDALKLFVARELITAIGRGFNPNIALKLLKVDYVFELINLADIARNKNDMQRLKGRVIGQEGKSRRIIEELTECEICVYGKTIGLIGPVDMIGLGRKSVEMLLQGAMHASVFKFLESQRREVKRMAFEGKKL
jgi:ribosomal RNA assembly protein|tara:strand:- start:882 stop:1466 length:585 start_codon:yes stop_codon:yes gene_type:complete